MEEKYIEKIDKHELKLNDHDHEIDSLKNRVDDWEEQQKTTMKLVQSVDRLAINMENMLSEQKKQGARLERLEQAPADDFKHYKRLIIGCLATGIISTIVGAVMALILR